MLFRSAYKASRDELDPRSDAHAVEVEGMKKHFVRGSRKVGDLFNYRFKKAQVRGVALGQMLHIAQDSFAGCHTERDKYGAIVRFLSYGQQSSSKHADYDTDPQKVKAALSGPLNPVMFGQELLELRLQNREWKDVEPLVRRYFGPVDGAVKAAAGAHCA